MHRGGHIAVYVDITVEIHAFIPLLYFKLFRAHRSLRERHDRGIHDVQDRNASISHHGRVRMRKRHMRRHQTVRMLALLTRCLLELRHFVVRQNLRTQSFETRKVLAMHTLFYVHRKRLRLWIVRAMRR